MDPVKSIHGLLGKDGYFRPTPLDPEPLDTASRCVRRHLKWENIFEIFVYGKAEREHLRNFGNLRAACLWRHPLHYWFVKVEMCWKERHSSLCFELNFCYINFSSYCYYICIARDVQSHTGCNRRNGPDFGRVFLMLNYIEKPQNTYIQSWTVSEIMASEVWNFDSCYALIDYQIHIKTGRNMWFL